MDEVREVVGTIFDNDASFPPVWEPWSRVATCDQYFESITLATLLRMAVAGQGAGREMRAKVEAGIPVRKLWH